MINRKFKKQPATSGWLKKKKKPHEEIKTESSCKHWKDALYCHVGDKRGFTTALSHGTKNCHHVNWYVILKITRCRKALFPTPFDKARNDGAPCGDALWDYALCDGALCGTEWATVRNWINLVMATIWRN